MHPHRLQVFRWRSIACQPRCFIWNYHPRNQNFPRQNLILVCCHRHRHHLQYNSRSWLLFLIINKRSSWMMYIKKINFFLLFRRLHSVFVGTGTVRYGSENSFSKLHRKSVQQLKSKSVILYVLYVHIRKWISSELFSRYGSTVRYSTGWRLLFERTKDPDENEWR